MGLNMALNLQKHLQTNSLPPLHYSNRTLAKGQSLQDAGAIAENDFESLVETCDIIFTMISNDTVLETLIAEALNLTTSLSGKIFIDTSTIHTDTAATVAQRLSEKGATFISSPVFGASPIAAKGQLIFAMAGPAAAIKAVRPFIQNVMARKIIELGKDVRRSSSLKICGNTLVISFMEVICKSQILAEKTGLGTALLQDFIGDMFGPVLKSYSSRITSGAYAPDPEGPGPGFAATLACKDMTHALSIADKEGTILPTTEVALGRLMKAREFAGQCLDSSAVYGAARRKAGMGFWSEACSWKQH